MHEMEERLGSTGGLVKKKSSSGCLIIKKKVDGSGSIGASSGSRKFLDSSLDRKRGRLVLSDSESSEEEEGLEPIRRGGENFNNGSKLYHKGIAGSSSNMGRNGANEGDRKRSLDVFEFDEYDAMERERKRLKKSYFQDRLNRRELETGYSNGHDIIYKRKKSFYDNTSSSGGGKKYNSGFGMDDDEETHQPISSLRQKFRAAPDEPIRLQGKNGVLKVMVNKKKNMVVTHKSQDHRFETVGKKGSKSEVIMKKSAPAMPVFYSGSKHTEKPITSVKTERTRHKVQKPLPSNVHTHDSETDESDTPQRLRPTTVQASSNSKGVKDKGKSPPAEKIAPVKGKEDKNKRGSGTEKQLLREQIRQMLLNAGWTIDYRPRRNRDYLDAVYINPTGTAYWSIIKAYDALQKQRDEDNVVTEQKDASFTPLPKALLSKLTRQTRKKMEREMKMKQRNHGKGIKDAASDDSAEDTDGDKDNDKGSSRKDKAGRSSVLGDSLIMQGRKTRKTGRCTLLVRSSDMGLESDGDGYVPYAGKRTLLSWLIDCEMIHVSEKVQYMSRKKNKVMLEGWVNRDGIHCGCCSKILSISKFELHAGSKLRQPYQNIFLESGVSLLQCQIDAWNKQDESKRIGFNSVKVDGNDPNDDTCGLCGDGGDLICCDGCPSTFHQSCLDIQMLPDGDWHCPNCTCQFCGIAGGNSEQGKLEAVHSLLTCVLCERKYHESCGKKTDALPADIDNSPTTFCGQNCQELFVSLQKLIGVKHELESGFSWSLIHRTGLDIDTSHRGFPQRVECNSKLAVALSIMDECFLPIIDRRSGINLIHNVLYNSSSNFSRLNYGGFYTVILERGDEVISAASIRIHGSQLAEMPFIGTRHIYRRQGMMRRLFSAIESVLGSLKVEKLIIPAIAEHMHTWTVVFGFNPLEESLKREMRFINMLVFPGTDMLQKPIKQVKITNENMAADSGAKAIVVKEEDHLMPDSTVKIEADSSTENNPNVSNDDGLDMADDMNVDAPSTEDKVAFTSQPVKISNESSIDLNSSSSTSHQVDSKIGSSDLEPSVTVKSQGVVEDVQGADTVVAYETNGSEPVVEADVRVGVSDPMEVDAEVADLERIVEAKVADVLEAVTVVADETNGSEPVVEADAKVGACDPMEVDAIVEAKVRVSACEPSVAEKVKDAAFEPVVDAKIEVLASKPTLEADPEVATAEPVAEAIVGGGVVEPTVEADTKVATFEPISEAVVSHDALELVPEAEVKVAASGSVEEKFDAGGLKSFEAEAPFAEAKSAVATEVEVVASEPALEIDMEVAAVETVVEAEDKTAVSDPVVEVATSKLVVEADLNVAVVETDQFDALGPVDDGKVELANPEPAIEVSTSEPIVHPDLEVANSKPVVETAMKVYALEPVDEKVELFNSEPAVANSTGVAASEPVIDSSPNGASTTNTVTETRG